MTTQTQQQIITGPFKAITTRYIGPTDFKGSRVKATDNDGNSATVTYDSALNRDQNHAAACRALAEKMGWDGDMIGGATKNGYAFVFTGGALHIS